MSKEVKIPCKVSIIARQCECGGEIQRIYSSTATLEDPLMYLHEGSRCGGLESLDISYLYQSYFYSLPTEKNKYICHQLCDWRWLEGDDGKILRITKNENGETVYRATCVKFAVVLNENGEEVDRDD